MNPNKINWSKVDLDKVELSIRKEIAREKLKPNSIIEKLRSLFVMSRAERKLEMLKEIKSQLRNKK
jgi:hypothetical protein